MEKKLAREDVQKLLQDLRASVLREECWTCDCLQGFLTQLEIDTDNDVSDLTDPLKVSHEQLHCCLGCDPCPPAEAFSDYLRKQ